MNSLIEEMIASRLPTRRPWLNYASTRITKVAATTPS
jgi:hypothetical protein